MDARQFLAEFGHIASAPGGVQRLRELVLSLAYQGSLCPHSHENTEALLVSIETQRVQHSHGDRVRKKPSNSSTVLPFKIPIHWRWLSLGEVGHSWGQKTPTEDFTYIDVSSIDNQRGKLSQFPNVMAASNAPSRARKVVRKGDVIYSTVRPYLLNVAIIDRDFDHEPIASTAFAVVHPWDGVLPRFVYLYLRSSYFVAYVQSAQIGMAYPAISDEKFYSGLIPLPPTSEQERIVAKVDELMVLCDKLETQQQQRDALCSDTRAAVLTTLYLSQKPEELDRAWYRAKSVISKLLDRPEAVEQLKVAILELAVAGRLTQQLVSISESVVERLQSRKHKLAQQKKIKRETSVVDFPGVHELKRPIPNTWVWCRLNDVASVVRGGSPRPAGDPRFYGGDIPFLKVADVTRSNGMFVNSFTASIKKEGLTKTRLITERTVLLTNSGATLGVPAICTFKTTFNDGIAAFVELADEVFDEYLYFYLKAKSQWFLDIASRGQGQPNLNTDIIRSTWFPLPPLAEQRVIVDVVKRLFSICDQLGDQLERSRLIAVKCSFASVSAITGVVGEDKDDMKAPKTELVSRLRLGVSPADKDQAPLAALLIRNQGELAAKALWQVSGLEIDDFYRQLKTEMARGWIVEPEPAYMREVAAS